MKTIERKITVFDINKGFADFGEEGVVGYSGKLNIRPPYQREFVYNEKQSSLVIDSVLNGFPLGILYWYKRGDNYEILDGQQRILSICKYINGTFDYNGLYFSNLPEDMKEALMNYELNVYICNGGQSEVLDWFERVNIQGEALTNQEFRNAIYTGNWLMDAKRYFSRSNCPAKKIGDDYIKGNPIRQEILEKVLKWNISTGINHRVTDDEIRNFMAQNQYEKDAKELWGYFKSVIEWVESLFPEKNSAMRDVPWGPLYNQYKDVEYDADELKEKVHELISNDEIKSKKGVYIYLLTGDEKHLNIRQFSKGTKQSKYEEQGGKCAFCKKDIDLKDAHADHIIPWSKGGRTEMNNCQVLCKICNLKKGASQ